MLKGTGRTLSPGIPKPVPGDAGKLPAVDHRKARHMWSVFSAGDSTRLVAPLVWPRRTAPIYVRHYTNMSQVLPAASRHRQLTMKDLSVQIYQPGLFTELIQLMD